MKLFTASLRLIGSISLALLCVAAARGAEISIAPLERNTPVDFEREVLPFLRDNCLACHCQTTKKGGLNLETPELMLKGGDTGPVIVPNKAGESLALQAAAHQDEDLKMPPRDNKAKAKNLTPTQLALFKLWIDQGAKPSPKIDREIRWQPLPAGLNAILAVAITPDGQVAACARANRLSMYHLPTGRCVAQEEAHRDQINALAFSPDGTRLASGGYREVKLWRRPREVPRLNIPDAGVKVAVSPDGKWLATAGEDGTVKLWEFPDGKLARNFAAAQGPIAALKFSPDNAKLVCGSTDKSLSIWNVADGNQLAKVETLTEVNAVVWLSDGIAIGSADGAIRLWTQVLEPLKELTGHNGAVTALDAVGNVLLSGGADGSVRTWDLEKGLALVQMAHGGPVTSVAIRADGKRLASAGLNNLAKLWDEAGKPIAELRGNRRASEFADERDRWLQVANSNAGYRKNAQADTEKQVQAAQERVKKSTDAIAPKQQDLEAKQKALTDATDGKGAAEQALVAADGELKKAGEVFAAAEKAAQEAAAAVEALKTATPPDQTAIDKAASEATAKMQEVEKAKGERAKREAEQKQAAEKIEPATKKVAEADKALKAAQTARNVVENELSLAKGAEVKVSGALSEAKAANEAAETGRKKADEDLQAARKAVGEADKPIRAIAFSPGNHLVATAGDDQMIHTWSLENGAACEVFAAHSAAIGSLVFAPTGELISTAADRIVAAHDVDSEWKLERILGSSEGPSPFADRITALAFSNDGELLGTGGGEPSRAGEIKVWKPSTGELVRDLPNVHSDAVFGLAFSPDNRFLASGAADKMARLIDLSTGKVVRNLEGHTHHVLGVAWSLDGRTLATAGADNLVKIWDTSTGSRRKNIEGYEKEVTAIRFTGASDQLVTASGDNRVRLVNTEGKDIRSFPEVADYMQAAAVTADGRIIAAGGQDSVLRVWNAADGKLIAKFPPALQ